jgi:UDP-N-acetylmuramoyl-L-alanyl-D-glutamate--2,6-diaminopimelate ligase
VNLDDPFGRELVARLPAQVRVLGYTLAEDQADETLGVCSHLSGSIQSLTKQGITMEIVAPTGHDILRSRLLGRFNAYNLLAALATLIRVGVPLERALQGLSKVPGVPGRMECFGGGKRQPLVVVDYAHTPDGLEQALRALREICSGAIWCVFGCGGERDSGKRPFMGQVAEEYADHVVLTHDNPRGEDPIAIMNDILSGIRQRDCARIELDRAKAIREAVLQADEDDVVLVAGKGHEAYQEIQGQRLPFSDRDVVRRIIQEQLP